MGLGKRYQVLGRENQIKGRKGPGRKGLYHQKTVGRRNFQTEHHPARNKS